MARARDVVRLRAFLSGLVVGGSARGGREGARPTSGGSRQSKRRSETQVGKEVGPIGFSQPSGERAQELPAGIDGKGRGPRRICCSGQSSVQHNLCQLTA